MSISARQHVPKVSQLATAIARNLRDLGNGWVEGEIQKPKSYPSGHTYFTLADGQSSLDVVVWPEDGQRVGSKVEEGALVQAHFKRVGFNPKTSRVSLHVDRVRPTGIGELLRRRAESLAQLQAEGLTDPARRKPLPAFPRRVGVIAPHDSDSKVDVIEALRERFPPQEVIFLPTYVEGVKAVDSIIAALAHLQEQPAIDVIVLARGGGGPRELMPFDDLAVCKAIFACAVPVVTSIAHTKQRPNCDHVAAACAHVPRVAAELVVPAASELSAELDRLSEQLAATPACLGERGAQLVELWRRARITERFERRTLELATLRMRLSQAADAFYNTRSELLRAARERLADVPGRVPLPSDVASYGVRIDSAAARFRGGKLSDYARALDRHGREARRVVERRLDHEGREVEREGETLAQAAARRLDRAATDLTHLSELIEARDFRRLGWVRASDRQGKPIQARAGLKPGDAINLSFRDGQAEATIDRIKLGEDNG